MSKIRKKSAKPRLIATKENDTGRNTHFQDSLTGENMTRAQTVKKIKKGEYDDFHIRKINGLDTPVSNPDSDTENNLD
jgi:hypothetical protein